MFTHVSASDENFDKPRIEIYGEAEDRNNLEEERELRGSRR